MVPGYPVAQGLFPGGGRPFRQAPNFVTGGPSAFSSNLGKRNEASSASQALKEEHSESTSVKRQKREAADNNDGNSSGDEDEEEEEEIDEDEALFQPQSKQEP
jgi:hypothetical protein